MNGVDGDRAYGDGDKKKYKRITYFDGWFSKKYLLRTDQN